MKTGPFLGLLGSKTHFMSAWKVPGSLASALASAWEVSDLVSMHFETKKRTKTGVFGQKRDLIWAFWGPKVDQKLLETGPGGPLRVPGRSRPMLKAFWGPNLTKKVEKTGIGICLEI